MMIKNTNSMRILREVSKVMQQCTSIHFWAKFKFTVLISIAPYLWSSLVSWNSRIDVWLSYQGWGVRLKGRGRGDEFRDRTAVSHYTSCAVFHSGNTVFTSLDEKCPWNFSLINFPHFIHFWLFFRQILLEMTGPGLTSHQSLSRYRHHTDMFWWLHRDRGLSSSVGGPALIS